MTIAHRIPANGAEIPALGLGTWPLKGRDCAEIVGQALGLGYRHIDTAAMYGNEEAVGDGLRSSPVPRDAVFVTTKVWNDSLEPGQLEASAEASLKRLGLDQVDLLLIHWPNPSVPLARCIPPLANTQRRGLARHVGVSNFTSAMVDEAVRIAGDTPLVANQCEYHPYIDQSAVLAACRRHGLTFTSYSPLGQGSSLLAEPAIAGIASRLGRTPAQVVLRWHVQQDGVAAIPKSGNPLRLAENLAVFDFALEADDLAAIHALARRGGRIVSPAFAPAWDAA